MSQSEHQLRQDMKPVMSAQQQQHIQARLGYASQNSAHLPQSLSFQYPGSTRSGSPTTNQRTPMNTQTNLVPSQRQLQQHYMIRPPPDYQATVEPNSSGLSALQSRLLSRSPLLVNVSDNMGVSTDQSNRNIELRNSNISVPKSYASVSTSQANSVSSGQTFTGIPKFPGLEPLRPFPGLENLDGTPITKPFPGLAPLNDGVPVTVHKPFPGMSFSDEIQISGGKLYSDMPSAMSRPLSGLNHTPSSTPTSVSESFRDIISISNAGKSYLANNSASNQNHVSLSQSFPNGLQNNSITASKKYTAGMPNSNTIPISLTQQYINMASTLQSSQGSQMMPITTMAPTYSAAKSRATGKQVTSRASKSNGPYHKQQKPPNVNVGPEGLNISQRPPVMSTDWRHAYAQQSQQQISNINAQLRMTYPRNLMQNYGQNINNGNNYQSHHINPNSPSNGANSVSLSSSTENALSGQSEINQMNSVGNRILAQQTMIDNDNNVLSSSRLHTPNSLAPPTESMSHPQQIFSPSPSSNSSQNMVSLNNMFNLDFLDNLECPQPEILSFDVLEETDNINESTFLQFLTKEDF